MLTRPVCCRTGSSASPWHHGGVRCDVVEGEPGIFPEPVARVLRKIGGLFGGNRRGTGEIRDTAEPPQADSSWGDLDPTRPDEPAATDPQTIEPPRAEP